MSENKKDNILIDEDDDFEVDDIEEDIKFDERKFNENMEMYDWENIKSNDESDGDE